MLCYAMQNMSLKSLIVEIAAIQYILCRADIIVHDTWMNIRVL